VAEGVDGLGQAHRIRELGCDELQGFLISQAVTAEEFGEFYLGWQGLEHQAGSQP
jgi:EAL domain-containing protein (putative c-di-GMP-specific phosphodiesterase class I)